MRKNPELMPVSGQSARSSHLTEATNPQQAGITFHQAGQGQEHCEQQHSDSENLRPDSSYPSTLVIIYGVLLRNL